MTQFLQVLLDLGVFRPMPGLLTLPRVNFGRKPSRRRVARPAKRPNRLHVSRRVRRKHRRSAR